MSNKPNKYSVTIHNSPIPQNFPVNDSKESKESYINHLTELELLDDDFDVEIKQYIAPISFKKFVINPFYWMSDLISVECKTGICKLPKEIVEIYMIRKGWNFENYHYTELISLLYLHYYKDCDEWRIKKNIDNAIANVLEALPHFKSISELFSYAFTNEDLAINDFDMVIEVDEHGSHDVTNRN